MTTEEDGNTLDGTPPEKFRARARAARRDGDRRQLRRRTGADARDHRADGGGDAAAPVGAAERRQAARRRRAQHLPVLARVHGVVRAPVHPAQRAGRRRLLRHDAGAHPPDQGGGPRRLAPGARPAPAVLARRGTAGRRRSRRRPVPREQKSRLARRAGARRVRDRRRAAAAARLRGGAGDRTAPAN